MPHLNCRRAPRTPPDVLVDSAVFDEEEEEEDPSGNGFELSEDRNVQVIIRVRPLSGSEISLQGYRKCVRRESCHTITWTGSPELRFTFDAVADENVSQEKLFKVAGLPMVDNCMRGYHSCMFAYGQTGSGKTHTMLGDIESRRHNVNCGMTPRVFECLFSRIQEKEARQDENLQFSCKCSFLEIYNEQILDLLDPSSKNLQIREDAEKGIYVENLKEIEVTKVQDVIHQLVQGAAHRKVAATNMNCASSRSHSVFTCIIESQWKAQGETHHRLARLNLVDLAGSERQKNSGAEGERLKEATNINKSLSTLGLVIMNLVNMSDRKIFHVPYRDSKLTFLLQDSLGGNSKTTIIANISPSNCCSLETLSTLKFAQRAKFIKNNAIVNEDASGDLIAMKMQIQRLKKEVSRLQGLVNGEADNQENDMCTPGSPRDSMWEGLHRSSIMHKIDKRIPHMEGYDAALVRDFRTQRDQEITLQALTSENAQRGYNDIVEDKEIEVKKVVKNLEHQFMEMNEENEKLMGLYQRTMQEKDDLKRMIASGGLNRIHLRKSNCRENIVGVDGDECLGSDESHILCKADNLTEETFLRSTQKDVYQIDLQANDFFLQGEQPRFAIKNCFKEIESSDDTDLMGKELDRAREMLSSSVKSANVVDNFQKTIGKVEKLSREIEMMGIDQIKQQEIEFLKLISFQMHERRSLINKKLLSLRYSLSSSDLFVVYFEQREAQARARANAAQSYLDQKKEELQRLQAHKDGIEEAKRTFQQSEVEMSNKLSCMKLNLDENRQRKQRNKLYVLFAIDKAGDLLEEEKIKLQAEISMCQEKLGVIRREVKGVDDKYKKVGDKIWAVEMEIQNGQKSVEQMELGLEYARGEKVMLLEFRENEKAEIERWILEYMQSVFDVDLKDAEIKCLDNELLRESKSMENMRSAVSERTTPLWNDKRCQIFKCPNGTF